MEVISTYLRFFMVGFTLPSQGIFASGLKVVCVFYTCKFSCNLFGEKKRNSCSINTISYDNQKNTNQIKLLLSEFYYKGIYENHCPVRMRKDKIPLPEHGVKIKIRNCNATTCCLIKVITFFSPLYKTKKATTRPPLKIISN